MAAEWITFDDSQKRRSELLLAGIRNGASKAASRAINRAILTARSESINKAREEYTVKAKDVRETLKISKATPRRPIAVISSLGAPLPLSSFQVSPKTVNGKRRSAIRVSVKKGGRQSFDRAFIARPSGQIDVYERAGKKRLPIRKLFGPSVPQMVGNPKVISHIADKAREMMDKRLDHEIGRLLDGAR